MMFVACLATLSGEYEMSAAEYSGVQASRASPNESVVRQQVPNGIPARPRSEAVQPPAGLRPANAEKNGRAVVERSAEQTKKQVEASAEKLNDIMSAFDKDLHFQVHEETDRTYVQVLNRKTEEVLREYPPRELLDLVARIHDALGMILDVEV